MANYYVDNATGSDGDNGTTQTLAWATIEHTLESGALSAGDIVWVRRGHSETPTSDVAPAYDGTAASPIAIVCWPRPSRSISQADWTNGSATVDNIVGLSMALLSHGARWITAPSGKKYLITHVVDSNTVKILGDYDGATVTGASGACSIDADPLYSDRPTDVDGWDSDGDTMPLIDFNGAAYNINFQGDNFFTMQCISVADSADIYGNISITNCTGLQLWNCIISQDQNSHITRDGRFDCRACVFAGSGSYSTRLYYVSGRFQDCAFYGSSTNVLLPEAPTVLINCNVGVEASSGSEDIAMFKDVLTAINCKFGAANGLINWSGYSADIKPDAFYSENHNRVSGAHLYANRLGTITKTDVVAGSGDPQKRSGGSDSVVEILYNQNSDAKEPIYELAPTVFSRVLVADGTGRTFRFYVQSVPALTDDLWFDVSYIDTDGYPANLTAVDSISARTGASDWSQYIDVTVPAALSGSNIHIECKCNYYSSSSSNLIYIDPEPVEQ